MTAIFWTGAALVVTPLLALLGFANLVLYRQEGWRGPAWFWGILGAILGPILVGAILLNVGSPS
jgi:hypothetical protein